MIINLANNSELHIFVDCEENNYEDTHLEASDFNSSELAIINTFVTFNNSSICEYFDYETCMSIWIDINLEVDVSSKFYIYDKLISEDKVIVDNFVNLIKSKFV